jgi:steroid 5-alpha reductase family enzyme
MSRGFATARFFETIPFVVVALLVLLSITYLCSRVAGRHSVIDVAWGLLFCTVALVSFVAGSGHGDTGRRWLLLIMTLAWGGRLAFHIGRRSIGKGEDPRYEAMLANRGQLQTIALVYGLQGLLALIISAPLQVGAFEAAPLTPLAYVGAAIWLLGVLAEGVGDWQLEQFRADPANKGHVMDRGLWHYTRHPNYFGDACVWTGIFLVTAERWPGVLTFFSLLIMIYLLAFGSGKKVLERSMAKRPGYPEYMQRTSGFIPWFPRKG